MPPARPERWTVELGGQEERFLLRLPAREQDRIVEALERLETDPTGLDLKPLHGRPEWRLRVGKWRILLRQDARQRRIVVVGLGSRGDIYKKK